MRRGKISPRKSRKLFSKTAARTHKRNVVSGPMRGGIRL
jgi:hypothetical protein